MIRKQPDLVLAKKLNIAAIVISVAVLFLVGLMRQVKLDVGIDFSFLPPIHASLNALCALSLIAALYFIKTKQVDLHQKAVYTALGLSFLFLLSYVAYHFTTPETIFGDLNGDRDLSPEEIALAGSSRTIYLIILLSHIVLAAVSLPFILFTFIRGYTGQYEKHKKMARWVYPIWLYVAITGPICYLLLAPYYA